MTISERVSIHNIVVRFLTKKEDADKIASLMGMKTYQVSGINRYVVSGDVSVEHPEIYDATGLIFDADSQKEYLDSKLWVQEFVKELVEV